MRALPSGRSSLALLASVVLGGCGPTTVNGRPLYTVRFRKDATVVREVLPTPVDQVWAALPGAFVQMGYPGGPATEGSDRAYATPYLNVRGKLYPGELTSSYLDCGRTPTGTPAADEYSVTFAILARVQPAPGGGTVLDVALDGTAHWRGANSDKVVCRGTGKLEHQLIQFVAARVTAAASPGRS